MSFDLWVCHAMGWTYEDLAALPEEVYQVLTEELTRKR